MKEDRLSIDEIATEPFLKATLLRSSIRCGSITGIRLPHIPAHYTIIRSSDLPATKTLSFGGGTIPLLASREVRYRGQPIAVIVGPDLETCIDLRDSIEIGWERRTPVTLDALPEEASVTAERTLESGDVVEAFATAFHITEGEYTISPAVRRLHEPTGAAASVRSDSVDVWAPTRWLYHLRDSVAATLGRDRESVRAILCATGPSTDAYLWRPSLYACLAASASAITGLPVRLLAEPGDIDSRPATPGARITCKTGLDREGNLVALETDIVCHTGSGGAFSSELVDRICLSIRDANPCGNYTISARAIDTDAAPSELYAGFGSLCASFATEVHAARLAEIAGIDPCSRRPARFASARPGAGQVDLVELSAQQSDFHRKYAACEMQKKRRERFAAEGLPLRGVGIVGVESCSGFLGGRGPVAAQIRIAIESDGSAIIATSSPDERSILRRIAARRLNLSETAVASAPKVTGSVPDSGPSILGTDLAVQAKLISLGAATLNGRRFREPLPLEVTRTARKKNAKQFDPLTLSGSACVSRSEAAMVVEVAVDPVSLRIRVKGVWAIAKIGVPIDERAARSAFVAELADAFESCRNFEERWEEAGVDESGHSCPPPVSLDFVAQDDEEIRPIDGLAASAFLPAFIAAVSQATGFYFDTVPLGSDLLHRYIEVP